MFVWEGSHAAKAGPNRTMFSKMIILPLPPERWDYRYTATCCAYTVQSFIHARQAVCLQSHIPSSSRAFSAECAHLWKPQTIWWTTQRSRPWWKRRRRRLPPRQRRLGMSGCVMDTSFKVSTRQGSAGFLGSWHPALPQAIFVNIFFSQWPWYLTSPDRLFNGSSREWIGLQEFDSRKIALPKTSILVKD